MNARIVAVAGLCVRRRAPIQPIPAGLCIGLSPSRSRSYPAPSDQPSAVTAVPAAAGSQERPYPLTAHQEIREAAHVLAARSTDGEFTVSELIAEMKARGSRYPERTIRTHVTSRMCANAPKNHTAVYNDFWCVARGSGRYRLFRAGTDEAVRLLAY